MPIHVEISTTNDDAFSDEPVSELVRALRDTALKLEEGRIEDFKVYDYNGQPCGKVTFTEDD